MTNDLRDLIDNCVEILHESNSNVELIYACHKIKWAAENLAEDIMREATEEMKK